MTHRIQKVNNLIRQELGQMLQHQIKDPRIGSVVSITEVLTTPDLRYAKVYISVLGNETEKKATLKILIAAAGFFRRELAQRLTLRRVPELSFHQDNSIERGARLLELFENISKPTSSGD